MGKCRVFTATETSILGLPCASEQAAERAMVTLVRLHPDSIGAVAGGITITPYSKVICVQKYRPVIQYGSGQSGIRFKHAASCAERR